MTIEDITAISELVGTVGVIASLVFVGVQVRQNTVAVRAQVHQDITSSYIAVADMLSDHASVFVRGISATPESFVSMSDADKLIYFGCVFAFFKHFENMHSQYERGLIDHASWAAWREHIFTYYQQPGVQLWWTLRGETFSPSFRAFLKSSPASSMKSIVDLLQSGS
jgi:hypothetical protein